MPLSNAYGTLNELKTHIGIAVTDTADDDNLYNAGNAAARWIDTYCGRRFWLDSSAVARPFEATDPYLLTVDDIGDTTGLTIKIDDNGDGTYETTFASTDYQLLPVGAATSYPEARPWYQIHAVGNYTFPKPTTFSGRKHLVEVTAKWGWPAVPADVKEAWLIQSHRLFTRRKSPEGVAGFNDFGVVRVNRGIDDQVEQLLSGYKLVGVH